MEHIERIKMSDLIAPSYYEFAKDVMKHGHTHYDCSGGRGSTKSSAISLLVPQILIKNPNTHAVIFRKVANTLRDSVFAQYIWAIGELGMSKYWISRVNPMELIYIPTGQRILFRGADDPMKIKSIKVPFGYIAVTHFEEKDQFSGRKEIRTILQSTMRGGEKFWNFESYNPPISRDNWANVDSLEERPNRLCHKSTYLDVPREWLGEEFINEAEWLKQTDEREYRHEYLGEAVGTGGNVFEKLEYRDITDDEMKHFDRIFQGVDWGYYPDAYSFIRLHYDVARETLYLLAEHYVHKASNEDTAAWIREKGYNDMPITCDSAEPKSIADYRSSGVDARAAIKGAGSVDYSMKWLQRRKIVVDRRRTPQAAKELSSYEYERNRDGEIISSYPDKNNHVIDSIRYAVEPASRRYGVRA